MKLFTVKLTDEERAKLEAHRVRLGLRAQTDVIRHWIAAEPSVPGKIVIQTQREADNESMASKARAAVARGGRLFVDERGVSIGPVASKPGSRLKGSK